MSPRRGGLRRYGPARARFAVVTAVVVGAIALVGVLHDHGSRRDSTGVGTSVTASASPAAVDARRQLASLDVVDQRPLHAGYQRGCGSGQRCSFGPAWSDDTTAAGSHNGCDTRNDMLAKDLRDVQFRAGSRCVVVSGNLHDRYTGHVIPFRRGATSSQAVQIDHLVPLELAWDLGAWRWSQKERDAYANDEDLVLAAVDGPANEAKGADGPSEWMPPDRNDWCGYDAQFVAILAHYRLAITEADHRAVAAILAHCSVGA